MTDVTVTADSLYHSSPGFVFRLVGGTAVKTKAMARQLIEKVVKVMFFRGKPNTEKIIDTVFEFYLESVGDEDEEAITSAMIRMYGDVLFTASSLQVADFHAGIGLNDSFIACLWRKALYLTINSV